MKTFAVRDKGLVASPDRRINLGMIHIEEQKTVVVHHIGDPAKHGRQIICGLQMIEAVVQAGYARKRPANRKGAHVAGDPAPRASPRELQHRKRQIHAGRPISAPREKFDRQAGAARDIEVRFSFCGKSIEDLREQPAHRSKKTVAEGLIVSVGEGAIGLVQCAIA